jgi:hypothetical protein
VVKRWNVLPEKSRPNGFDNDDGMLITRAYRRKAAEETDGGLAFSSSMLADLLDGVPPSLERPLHKRTIVSVTACQRLAKFQRSSARPHRSGLA